MGRPEDLGFRAWGDWVFRVQALPRPISQVGWSAETTMSVCGWEGSDTLLHCLWWLMNLLQYSAGGLETWLSWQEWALERRLLSQK